MKTIERTKQYSASPEEVFDCLDDLGVTGMHMTQSSMPMMGGKMDLTFLTPNKTGPHTKYRWTGKVLWWELNFTVEVVTWERGKEKVWETIGATKLIIYSWFRMNLNVWPMTMAAWRSFLLVMRNQKVFSTGFFVFCWEIGIAGGV
jgi:hypothetical protein